MKEDMVNSPSHYTGNGIECIDAMLSAYGAEAVVNFCRLNAFKYLWRAGKKWNTAEDLAKAIWYINKCKEIMEANNVRASSTTTKAD